MHRSFAQVLENAVTLRRPRSTFKMSDYI
jgi:hypothetical protein